MKKLFLSLGLLLLLTNCDKESNPTSNLNCNECVMEYELLNGADLQTLDAIMQIIDGGIYESFDDYFTTELYVPMAEYCEEALTEIQGLSEEVDLTFDGINDVRLYYQCYND